MHIQFTSCMQGVLLYLTLFCNIILLRVLEVFDPFMLSNGQTYFKNLLFVHTARFLKYVWPFYNIMHERVNNKLKSGQKKKTTDMIPGVNIISGKVSEASNMQALRASTELGDLGALRDDL